MMRLWIESYARERRVSSGSSAFLSVALHVILAGAAVYSTQRGADVKGDWIENRAYYMPPPDRRPSQQGSRETIKYIETAPEGLGAGLGGPVIRPDRKPDPETSASAGDMGRDLTNSAAAPRIPSPDSVFSVLEVDSSVVRYPESIAPAYPLALLREGVQGSVTTQYVVDTTGEADTASLRILRSTHPDFSAAVRAALPYMRFFPAKVGDHKVRQLVEQEFSFKIEQAATQATPAAQASEVKKPEAVRRDALRPVPRE
ncbi:MAG TPA: TonB family protein [Gemmatimonadaceae bacterium]|nr:TonB family protein [Gemmatimonadaceae bacterium]